MELTLEDLQYIDGPIFNDSAVSGIVVEIAQETDFADTVSFLVCVPKVWRDKRTGKEQFRPNLVTVRAWGDLGHTAKKFVEGQGVLVQGRLEEHRYTDEKGQSHSSHYIGARYIQYWETGLMEEVGSE